MKKNPRNARRPVQLEFAIGTVVRRKNGSATGSVIRVKANRSGHVATVKWAKDGGETYKTRVPAKDLVQVADAAPAPAAAPTKAPAAADSMELLRQVLLAVHVGLDLRTQHKGLMDAIREAVRSDASRG